ncbi:ferric reductase NAD binding domain-containing protein [Dichotomopilus funicola]|uniref:Ferric reductase NAD binding domain-containing protein n=1 Tax=Dichotomopilus funicola TaxID=1934379 RepID=A0AAN6ZLJ0_9PEZI|nr:ferric reductase NAD binding domain-containing protein [Dichotomopilus funicola]
MNQPRAGPPDSSSSASGGEHGGGGGGGDAHEPGSEAMMAYFIQRQIQIERIMSYWAAGICSLIAIFVLFHWARWICVKVERSRRPAGVIGRPFVATTRFIRNLLVRRVPGFKSAGHALLVAAYTAVNLAIAFSEVDTTSLGSVGHRFGWVTVGNLALVIFLALKNTPLAFLTAYSYERLNCLHQIAGCTMFLAMLLHAACYTAFFNAEGRMQDIYSEQSTIAAIVAGFGFLTVVFSALVIRHIWYELFYVTHIAAWIMGIVAVGFHRPELAKKAFIIIVLAAAMWFTDRVIRAGRVLYYSANNTATLHPLPDGSTKIVMKKVPTRAEPGKHCFVWIPTIRLFETHPFTIHGSSPMEFTVKARNGFTRDLHKYAVAHPGASVKASIDGPYGTFPSPTDFDKIVLIAGGGGATFTFGLAVNVLERMTDDAPKNIVFIWSVKKHENLSWFKEQLELLRNHPQAPNIKVSLYVTRDSVGIDSLSESESSSGGRFDSSEDSPPLSPISPIGLDLEKNAISTPAPAALALSTEDKENGTTTTTDPTSPVTPVTPVTLKATAARPSHPTKRAISTTTYYEHPIKAGRPDTATLIRDAVRTTPRNQRVLVAACGPDGLMRTVRDTTARLIVGDGPAVELHCEEFGW